MVKKYSKKNIKKRGNKKSQIGGAKQPNPFSTKAPISFSQVPTGAPAGFGFGAPAAGAPAAGADFCCCA